MACCPLIPSAITSMSATVLIKATNPAHDCLVVNYHDADLVIHKYLIFILERAKQNQPR